MLNEIATIDANKKKRRSKAKAPTGEVQTKPDKSYSDPKNYINGINRPHKLPKDFAENVLELETQIDESDFTADTVDKLMQLY